MIYYLLTGGDHKSIVKAADHLTENTQQQTLIFHLNKVDSLSLIYRPRDYIDENQRDYH